MKDKAVDIELNITKGMLAMIAESTRLQQEEEIKEEQKEKEES